ncbi:MAG: desulfoferrodoxin [Candidatus Moraniibacteriota bacterium]
MTKLKQIYKCNVCGNIVEVLHTGQGELVCCGQSMELQQEKTEEEGLEEKHVPVFEKTESGYRAEVGSVPHPMEENHYIEWVELWVDGDLYERKFLKPGEQPKADFYLDYEPEKIMFREYCNVHGLWRR